MSSFNEAASAEIEAMFGRVKQGRFVSTQVAVTPYESPIGPGNINPQGFIADGAISNIDIFSGLIRPPVVVTSLPALPDDSYPVGSFAFLTTDAKLYRNTDGSTWSATIASGDITGHVGIPIAASDPILPDTTYPTGSFYFNSSDKHLRKTINGTTWILAVDAGDIVANTITAGQIAAATITATQIAAATITGSNIAATTITGANMVANTITAGQIAAGTITATELAANSVTASKILLKDDAGVTVLTGAGYAGSWLRFAIDGLYNSTFASGALGAITYQAAPGASVPYWSFQTRTGSPVTATLTAATSAPGGNVVRIAAGSVTGVETYGEIWQWNTSSLGVVSVTPGRKMMTRVSWRNDNASVGNPVRIRVQLDFRNAIGNAVSSGVYDSPDRTASDTADVYTFDSMSIAVPAGSHTAYVRIKALWASGAASGGTVDIAEASFQVDNYEFAAEGLSIGSNVWLRRSAAKTLTLDSDGAGTALTAVVLAGATPLQFSTDAFIRRSGTKTLMLDSDGAGTTLTAVDFKGAFLRGFSGTAFPASPSTNDQFYRTDIGMWFFYDGTRWLSTTLFFTPFSAYTSLMPVVGTTAILQGRMGRSPTFDTWLVDFITSTYVPTTNSGTKYWTVDLISLPAGSTLATFNTAADTASVFTSHIVAINALGATTQFGMRVNATKVSTPGSFEGTFTVSFRIIAT